MRPVNALGWGVRGCGIVTMYCGSDVAVKEAVGAFPPEAIAEFQYVRYLWHVHPDAEPDLRACRRHTRKEAGMLHSLAHPRVVQLMGLVLSPSRCAIVMDYAPRTCSLQCLRRAGEMRWRT